MCVWHQRQFKMVSWVKQKAKLWSVCQKKVYLICEEYSNLALFPVKPITDGDHDHCFPQRQSRIFEYIHTFVQICVVRWYKSNKNRTVYQRFCHFVGGGWCFIIGIPALIAFRFQVFMNSVGDYQSTFVCKIISWTMGDKYVWKKQGTQLSHLMWLWNFLFKRASAAIQWG